MTATFIEQQLRPDDPLQPRVASIARSAALATRLLTDLLELSRFEAGCVVAAIAAQRQLSIVNAVQPGSFLHLHGRDHRRRVRTGPRRRDRRGDQKKPVRAADLILIVERHCGAPART